MDGTMDSHRPTFASRLKETLKLFDLSPGKFPFDDRRVKKIIERRKQLRGQLFFDYLLLQAGIAKPSKIFPPLDSRQFEVLIREILSSDWGITEIGGLSQEVNEYSQETAASRHPSRTLQSGIKRACLIYYLLAWWDDAPHLKYSDGLRLPTEFTELTHAHFLFDIGVTANAASLLCTPLITSEPALVEKVFHALSISTDADPSVLILRYARMAKPELKPQEVLFLYVDALAKVNFIEAWSYQRSLPEVQREDILKAIYKAILCPRPLRAALQLLSVVPLRPFERDFLHFYALAPPQEIPEPSVAALHSLIILRLTVEGDYSTAVRINREFSQYGDRLLNSPVEEPRTFGMEGRNRPGMLIAQKAEESREMLRESVSLLPLEHRRQLESQLSEGGLSATASFGNPNAANANGASAAGTTMNTSGMEMSWEAVGAVPMHSTPPRASSASLGMPTPSKRTGTTARSPIVIPSSPSKIASGPPSPQKKSPLVAKFQRPTTPIDTQTLGRVYKPPTPQRGGLLPYMTPIRTPIVRDVGGSGSAARAPVDWDRSGAPPPTTGRAGSKNAFFNPDVRAVKGLILPSAGSSPLAAVDRGKGKGKAPRFTDDVTMRDANAEDETESEGEAFGELGSQSTDESFVHAPPPSSQFKSNTAGGLLSAASIVGIKKTQERERERIDKERENKERAAQREREMAVKRAKLEQARRSLGGNDSSFTSVGSSGGAKRKRDGDDNMGRSDEEMEEADGGARGKRKSDGGVPLVVRKPGSGPTAAPTNQNTLPRMVISVPTPAQSVTSMSARSGALVPPSSIAPSMTSAGGAMENKSPSEAVTSGVGAHLRRSSRISTTSGSATGSQAGGSARAPSPTPDASDHGGEHTEEEYEEPTSPQMPGAYILDEDNATTDGTGSGRKTRGAVKRTSTAKPASKSKSTTKSTKPSSIKASTSASTTTGARQTRSKRNTVSVPTPIAEDSVLEMVDEDERVAHGSPSKSKVRGKRGTSGAPAGTSRRNLKAVVEDGTEVGTETDDAMETSENPGMGERRSSRRLKAPATSDGDASSAAGGRKSGRKA